MGEWIARQQTHGILDRTAHKQIREDLKAGRIGLAQNRMPASTVIEDVRPENLHDATSCEIPEKFRELGMAALRTAPTLRDFRFAWQEMPQQALDVQQQKARDSVRAALQRWAESSGEASSSRIPPSSTAGSATAPPPNWNRCVNGSEPPHPSPFDRKIASR